MPPAMITKILQNLATSLRQILAHSRAPRVFCHQTEFPF